MHRILLVKDIPDILAANLVRLRDQAKYTQAGLAKAAKLSTSAISHIEYKQRWPHIKQLRTIARVLGVDVQELFTDPNFIPTPAKTVEDLLQVIANQEARIRELEARKPIHDDLLDALAPELEATLAGFSSVERDDVMREIVGYARRYTAALKKPLGANDDRSGDLLKPSKKRRRVG